MVIRRADEETEAGVLPSEELLDAMSKYNEELVRAGVMLDGVGLQPSSKGVKVRFSGGRPAVIDGPFTEAKELIAGYSVIEAGSLAEVVELVKRWPKVDGHGNAQIEIRRVTEIEEFETASPEAVETEQRIRAARDKA
ncbi:MAG TPA: YciI family protein [Actinophytocola sp.]|jgi:hypothetical protein|uniref:YciI family protein n=1 Tax=Actinophytocola sp. TaxID=1872138 RepID=UPI002F923B9E